MTTIAPSDRESKGTGETGHSDDGNTKSSDDPKLPEKIPIVVSETNGIKLHWKETIATMLHGRSRKSIKKLFTVLSNGGTTRSGNCEKTKNQKKRKKKKIVTSCVEINHKDVHPCGSLVLSTEFKPSWRNFEYRELAAATDDFSSERVIGKGGHAVVYRGTLDDGQLVAIKRLSMIQKSEEERIGDFLSELGMIAHVNHPNAACLLGFGVDGGLHLILKLSPNGSLESRLHARANEKLLTWRNRYDIALGVSKGLLYLHHGCHRRIIHRDIKPANILLTDHFQPQISDFGLAKWLPEKMTHHQVFPIEGTFGYMAPEFFMHGVFSRVGKVW
ncbi:Protein kinase superfamily protein [Zostera marina]|uniref:Protein kinase superfamily protein n=1 Tax=Zostera marina TaxID=29655 RepID=A0A0K9NIU2_ZOSMR|nr:Protein kinase superfamily protein [Zostera marina]